MLFAGRSDVMQQLAAASEPSAVARQSMREFNPDQLFSDHGEDHRRAEL